MDLESYQAKSGTFEPVWTLEIQTVIEDVDKILDAIMQVHPLNYGNYQRTATISAIGIETAQPKPDSTTHKHVAGFEPGDTESYPFVELKISIARDVATLEKIMDAVLDVHHYEQPAIFVREAWASRSNYNPVSDNPNRWWNDGRGMPNRIDNIVAATRKLNKD